MDDQLAQAQANLVLAKANLQVAEANLELAKITLERNLEANRGSSGSVSQLTIDQNRAAGQDDRRAGRVGPGQHQVNQATVQQYADLQAFQKIIAPFPGVITARTVDPGRLSPPTTPAKPGRLFYLMQTDPLRVFVNVPQVFATTLPSARMPSVYREEDPESAVLRQGHAHGQRTRPQHAHAC